MKLSEAINDVWPLVSIGVQLGTAYMVLQLIQQSSESSVSDKGTDGKLENNSSEPAEATERKIVSPEEKRSVRGENVYGAYKKKRKDDLPNKSGGKGPFEDEPWGEKVKYGTSIPLSKAMSFADEVMIAFECNGDRLHPDRGYPCRLVIPGYIGGRMIKWLARVNVLDHESHNCYHYWDNKYLPPQVTAEKAAKEGWWYKQEYIINELSLNSAITYPNHNDSLPLAKYIDKKITLKGYAHSGGGRPVTRVEISTSRGEVWDLAEIHRTEQPNPYGKVWCWVWWSFDVEAAKLQDEIWVRAWDTSNSPQPERPVWTLMGQSSNHIFRVKVHVDNENGKAVYKFEHPTQPGQQTGGWATRVADKVKSAGYGKITYVEDN